MEYAYLADRVALDTTAVRNFHDAGLPHAIRQYLPQAVVISDVQRELNAEARNRPNLQTLIRGWPNLLPSLPQPVIDQGLAIQELLEPEYDTEHLGEIFTVLGAVHFGVPLVITDDRDGRKLAIEKGVAVIGSTELACEMVCRGRLHEQNARAIYRANQKDEKRPEKEPNWQRFDALLDRYRTAGSSPAPE